MPSSRLGWLLLGALGFVAAERAAALGGDELTAPTAALPDPLPSGADPDGKAVGELPAKPISDKLITQTYYVGDLLITPDMAKPVILAGQPPVIDMQPVINLIEATVAPALGSIRRISRDP